MTRLSIATTSVPGDLFAKLETIAEVGFPAVELHEPDLTGFAESPKEIRRRAGDLGLSIDALQPFHDFEGLSGTLRDQAFARLDRKLDLLGELGAKTLLIGTSTHPNASAEAEQIQDDFQDLAERLRKHDLRAALIALPWARHLRTVM